MFQRLKPEVIGHFDLFRLFTPDLKIDAPEVWAKVERNVAFAVGYGALFEVNAAAFRKGWTTSYPGKEIFRLILISGGKICLSDDSHGVHAVGLNYLRLRQYLIESEVHTLWYLEKDTQSLEPVNEVTGSAPTRFARGTIAKTVGVDWKTHPFWDNLASTLEKE